MTPEYASGSDSLMMILDDSDPDRAVNLAQEFDWKRVTPGMVRAAKKEIYACSQRSLKARGFPAQFVVFRGKPVSGWSDIVQVTYDKFVARRFALHHHLGKEGLVQVFLIDREDVLADVDAFQSEYEEAELLVPFSALDRLVAQKWVRR